MIYLSVPNFVDNITFYSLIKEYIDFPLRKDCTNIPFQFDSVYGSFPYSYWNGDINSNIYNNENMFLYPDIEKITTKTAIPLRIDCTNQFLKKEDFYDRHYEAIFKLISTSGAFIELNNLELMKYLNNQFRFNYIYNSKGIIQKKALKNNFYLYCIEDYNLLPYKLNKNKIEILLNNPCTKCFKAEQEFCKQKEQFLQYNFYQESVYKNCLKNKNQNKLLNEILFYYNLGYTHFKIDAKGFQNLNDFNNYLIKNLFKKEYIENFASFINEKIEKSSKK